MRPSLWAGLTAVAIVVAGCAATKSSDGGRTVTVVLAGSQEVPPVTAAGTGTGSIRISADRSVTGSVTTSGVNGTAAHIHQAPAGQNGPVIIPLTKESGNVWSVPPGTKLTEAQYEAFKAGNLYVNVHTDANKGGEVRGQLKP